MSSVPFIVCPSTQPQFFDEAYQFYLDNRKSYDRLDFGRPLLNLMREAKKIRKFDGDQKMSWVLANHTQVIEIAYENNPIMRQIALASGPSLVQALYNISIRQSVFVRDNMAFYKYYSRNLGAFGDRLRDVFSKSLHRKNWVPVAEVIYSMNYLYLRDIPLVDLTNALLVKALPEPSVEIELCTKILPQLYDLFDEVARGYEYFHPIRSDIGDRECCVCVFQ